MVEQIGLSVSPMNRVLLIIGCLAFVAVILVLSIPTIMYGLEGQFRWREEASQLSPDGTSRVVVSKRVVFPAFDLVDPSILVRAELRDVQSRQILASEKVVLLEDSDFEVPTIKWDSGEIRITGMDRRQKQTITLKGRTNHSFQATPGSASALLLAVCAGAPELQR